MTPFKSSSACHICPHPPYFIRGVSLHENPPDLSTLSIIPQIPQLVLLIQSVLFVAARIIFQKFNLFPAHYSLWDLSASGVSLVTQAWHPPHHPRFHRSLTLRLKAPHSSDSLGSNGLSVPKQATRVRGTVPGSQWHPMSAAFTQNA